MKNVKINEDYKWTTEPLIIKPRLDYFLDEN